MEPSELESASFMSYSHTRKLTDLLEPRISLSSPTVMVLLSSLSNSRKTFSRLESIRIVLRLILNITNSLKVMGWLQC